VLVVAGSGPDAVIAPEMFEKKHLVDALLDRSRHRCTTIRNDGPSLRSPEAQESPGQTRPARPFGSRAVVVVLWKADGGSATMTRTDLRALFEIPD
jgi:hypothetical protein